MTISTPQLVRFPLLMDDTVTTNYSPCTIPWRLPSDDPKVLTPTELSWINLFCSGIPSYKYVLSKQGFYYFNVSCLFILIFSFDLVQEAC